MFYIYLQKGKRKDVCFAHQHCLLNSRCSDVRVRLQVINYSFTHSSFPRQYLTLTCSTLTAVQTPVPGHLSTTTSAQIHSPPQKRTRDSQSPGERAQTIKRKQASEDERTSLKKAKREVLS